VPVEGLLDRVDGLGGQRPGEVHAVDVGADVTGDGTDGERAHDGGFPSGMTDVSGVRTGKTDPSRRGTTASPNARVRLDLRVNVPVDGPMDGTVDGP
jgi:hypothetical protein